MSDSMERGDDGAERELVARARAGDGAALESLLALHQDRVYRTALGMVGGDQEAAFEVAQEVLVSAFRHFHQFRGASKFSTWLYRMVANFTKNLQVSRGRQRRRFVSLDAPARTDSSGEIPRDFAATGVDAREAAAGKELMGILQQRLSELPPEFRDVLVLRYIEDLSYEEISGSLEIPLGTVKSRVNRARIELRKAMGDSFSLPGGDP